MGWMSGLLLTQRPWQDLKGIENFGGIARLEQRRRRKSDERLNGCS